MVNKIKDYKHIKIKPVGVLFGYIEYSIENKDGFELGTIKFNRKQYVFEAEPLATFTDNCLEDMLNFIRTLDVFEDIENE